MQKRNVIIEYCFLSLMLISVLDSVFVGFSATKYRFILMFGALCALTLIQLVFRIHGIFIGLYVVLLLGYIIPFHQWMMNGFCLVYNRVMLQINTIFDMGFFYYIDVSIENYQRDVFVFLLFILLVINLLIYICRNHLAIYVVLVSVIEFMILVLTPYNIVSSFFAFLVGMFGYLFFSRRKYTICLVGCILLGIVSVVQLKDKGLRIHELSIVKEQAMETVRNISQGDNYMVSGGIGEGDMRQAQKISPKGIHLFTVETDSDETLYLKGFVSGNYEKNHWEREEQPVTVVEGNNAISLPYLFFDLHMSDFFSNLSEDKLVENETDLKFQYEKLNDQYYLWPYFSDLDSNLGSVSGDLYMTRANIPVDFALTYFPMKSTESFLKAETESITQGSLSAIEDNYTNSMNQYNKQVKKEYLDVPDKLKKNILKKFPELKKQKSLYQKVSYVEKILKNQYTYSYEQAQVPKGEDSIWYFLNHTKKGYCVQYASSAVMMYRTMGIPTRYVEGYKVDHRYLKKSDKVKVTDAFAHAWPEIYIKNIGWIPIEVTKVTTTSALKNEKERNHDMLNIVTFERTLYVLDKIKVVIMLITFVLFLIHGLWKLICNIQWNRKTYKEKTAYYYDVLTQTYGVEPAEIKDSKEMEIFLKSKYSPYEITKEEYNIIKIYIQILRKKL